MMELPQIAIGPNGPVVSEPSPALLSDLLLELERELGLRGVDLSKRLNRPGHRSVITANFEAEGLQPNHELLVLYTWHDGATDLAGYRAIPRFAFDPHELALCNHRLRRNTEPDGEWGAPRGWLPLVTDLYTLAVDSNTDPVAPPRVRATEPDFGVSVPISQAQSLCTIVTWWIAGIRSEAHQWDETQGDWLLDEPKLPSLQRAFRLV